MAAVRTVIKLVKSGPGTPVDIVIGSDTTINGVLTKCNSGPPTGWLKPLVLAIKSRDNSFVPSKKAELEALRGITSTGAATVLQECFGFFPGPALDLECRKMFIALDLVDADEFKKTR